MRTKTAMRIVQVESLVLVIASLDFEISGLDDQGLDREGVLHLELVLAGEDIVASVHVEVEGEAPEQFW